MPFGIVNGVGRRMGVLDGGGDRRREGAVLGVNVCIVVLSHWPHVAEHVSECERTRTQVAELVAQLVSESFHTSHMCGNTSACSGDLWRTELTCTRKCVATCC